jgi:hypothetical protein
VSGPQSDFVSLRVDSWFNGIPNQDGPRIAQMDADVSKRRPAMTIDSLLGLRRPMISRILRSHPFIRVDPCLRLMGRFPASCLFVSIRGSTGFVMKNGPRITRMDADVSEPAMTIDSLLGFVASDDFSGIWFAWFYPR